jgi:hypothetical protein
MPLRGGPGVCEGIAGLGNSSEGVTRGQPSPWSRAAKGDLGGHDVLNDDMMGKYDGMDEMGWTRMEMG